MRFRETNEAQYDANIETDPHRHPLLPVHGVRSASRRPRSSSASVGSSPTRASSASAPSPRSCSTSTTCSSRCSNSASSTTSSSRSGAALKKLFGLLDEEPSIAERAGAVDLPATGAIEVHDLSFGYGSTAPTCCATCSLTIAPGERLALVGPTGAGKSTLAKLVVRFYDPRTGSVSMGGVDLRDATMHSLRERIVVVPQEGFLFAGTVRDNVRVGRPEATDGEVEAAIDRARRARPVRVVARGPRHRGARARFAAVGRRTPAGLARRVPRSPTPRCSCSTRRRRTSIRVPSASSSARSSGSPRTAPSSSSRTGCRPRRAPTGSRSSTTVCSPSSGTHDELIAHGGRYARLFASWSASTTG